MKHKRVQGGIPRKTLAQKVMAELKRLSPADANGLRAELHADLATLDAKLRGNEPEDLDDAEDLRRCMTGTAAMQSVVSALSWVPAIRSAFDTLEGLHDTYSPGGPPLSPIHDSLFMAWAYADLEFGRNHDTLASVALAVAPLLGLSPEVQGELERLAESRLGLYRITSAQAPRVGESPVYRVRELVTERELSIQSLQGFELRVSELLLVRPIALPTASARTRGASHAIFATPYVVSGTNPEWVDYLEREAADLKVRLDGAVYEQLMRGRGNDRRWLEYVVDGYAGEREYNVVELRGIPDRPETLPNHLDHRPEDAFKIPPGASPRERSVILSAKIASFYGALASREGAHERQAIADYYRTLQELGVDLEEQGELLMPLSLFQGGPDGAPPWVDLLLQDGTLDADAIEYAEAAKQAQTSFFEVVDVDEGKSLRLRDLFADHEYLVSERAASTGTPTRIIVLARLVAYRGTYVIEGMLTQVAQPSLRAALVAGVAARCPVPAGPRPRTWIYDALRVWLEVMNEDRRRRMEAPRPTILTTSGDALVSSRSTYGFAEEDYELVDDVLHGLQGCVVVEADDEPGAVTFEIHRRDVVEGRIRLRDTSLTIETLSRERLDRIQNRLKRKLRGVLELIDRESTAIEELLAAAAPSVREPPPPEARAVIGQMLARRYLSSFLDEPIPALDGLTPRMAAKQSHLRDRLDQLLREHEFQVTRQVGPGVVDFSKLREQLELPR